ncbi:MAG: UDP-N-acetylmuramate: L-alanyl-gamma-D-glutamyl-meso-diaminopimelate ligase [Paraglaciecola sp.]|jgi:UDP-N-acetylmuramate: L-alanyl-gamma-D-glutamyl-meso-diaminopimelate ligase
MRIHLIATGGAVMHNLALALHNNHHTVTGSDDEIYNPARDRLAKYGLLPKQMGWHPENITSNIDAIILGMHARVDNPELLKAQELGIPIYSFPEYIYEHAKDKIRVVVSGSHGKTTTTSMIMHILRKCNKRFDYLVGAQLEGFERMVKLSDARLMIIEGDEYLSSALDRRPKFLHYKPQYAIMTGIAWDHINVFPTFKGYLEQFGLFLENLAPDASLFFYQKDEHIKQILKDSKAAFSATPYEGFKAKTVGKGTTIPSRWGENVPIQIFGEHNMENLKAAFLVCQEIGISHDEFFEAVQSFKGAAKRLQLLRKEWTSNTWLDFAHAPSKVRATVKAVKNQYANRQLFACVELHTFSSLNKIFLPEYQGTLNAADIGVVFFSEHTLKMKELPPISKADIQANFQHPNLYVFTEREPFEAFLKEQDWNKKNLLLMSSGNFQGVDFEKLMEELFD